MIRSEARFDAKRKRIDVKKTQFATAQYKEHDYTHRLSFYDVPPTQEISLEEFETWAIDRLRGRSKRLSRRPLLTYNSPRGAGVMLIQKPISSGDICSHEATA